MSSPPLHLVVFSKDRAFQCTALLLSLDLYMSPAPTSLTVIYKASSPFFLEGYHELEEARRVGSRNNDCKSERNEGREIGRALEGGNKLTTSAAPSPVCLPARFVPEDALGGFASALAAVMEGWTEGGRESGRKDRKEGDEEEEEAYVMWLVDDFLFHSPLDTTPFLTLLSPKRGKGGEEGERGGGQEEEVGERVWAIHTKLHPGISYSHTLDKVRKKEGRREGRREGGRAGEMEGGLSDKRQ